MTEAIDLLQKKLEGCRRVVATPADDPRVSGLGEAWEERRREAEGEADALEEAIKAMQLVPEFRLALERIRGLEHFGSPTAHSIADDALNSEEA